MSPAMTNAAITLTSEVESVMGLLCDLLDRETTAVQSADFVAFTQLQGDKQTLMTRYRNLLETLGHHQPHLKMAGDPVIERLKKVATRFQDCTKRNAYALDQGRKSTQRIVDRIVRAARDTVHANRQTYTRGGQAGKAAGPLSIKIDQVL